MRCLDTIVRDYERYQFICVTKGACPPPPTWSEVAALIEEVVTLRAQLAMRPPPSQGESAQEAPPCRTCGKPGAVFEIFGWYCWDHVPPGYVAPSPRAG